ncbi:TIGR02391 family protein [Streptomyces sp. NPDC001835]|uniref:TIGR02391 family protein n=1 Tax=Streptomyces sp. NPDC001835 TaxID=3154528 RepID=UPI0033269686
MGTSTKYAPWTPATVTAVADVLAATDDGLTGREISHLLALTGVADADGSNKREKLAHALLIRQAHDQASNCVIRFIREAMAPVRYTQQPEVFSRRRDDLNEVLVHIGLRVNAEGKWPVGRPRAPWMRRPGTPTPCGRSCAAGEHTRRSWRTAPGRSWRRTPSTPAWRPQSPSLTGEQLDGSQLIDTVLMPGATGTPRVAINTGATPTETGEQKGFAMLLKGLAGMYRNPTAHDPRLNRHVTDEELLELLTTLSMAHRRLDHARVQP